jgi:hypothetical protein
MASTKKTAKKQPGSRTANARQPRKSKWKAPKPPAKKVSPPKSKPKKVATKRAAPSPRKAARTQAVAPRKTFAQKLRDANARIDIHGENAGDEADNAWEGDERDVGDAQEGGVDADDSSEHE